MKKLATALLAVAAMALTGCSLPNLQDKSVDVGIGGIGGEFSTAIDPTTGTPLPSMKMGELDGGITTHKVGDGDIIMFRQVKSFWGSEIGTTEIKYLAKDSLGSFTLSATPKGPIVVNCTGKGISIDMLAPSTNATVSSGVVK